jgi:hypothetical protein
MVALTARVSLEQAHEAMLNDAILRKELYGGADDMAEWASHRVLPIEHQASLTDDQQRRRVLAESIEHFRQCRGASCNQGRAECTDNCLPFEMACTAGEEPAPLWWEKPPALIVASASLVGLCASVTLGLMQAMGQ